MKRVWKPAIIDLPVVLGVLAVLLGGLACGRQETVRSGVQPDGKGCCPPEPQVEGCMSLGGYSPQGCPIACDFYCSTNWRVEDDGHGCPVWRYDTRAPGPDENLACLPAADAGNIG